VVWGSRLVWEWEWELELEWLWELRTNCSILEVSDMFSSTLEIAEMSWVPPNKGVGYLSKEAVREMSRSSGWERGGAYGCWVWFWLGVRLWVWVNGANPGGPFTAKGCLGSPCVELRWIGLLKYSNLF
jgi:hypothetical protein